MARTEAVKEWNGQEFVQAYASEGAVKQDGTLKIYKCLACKKRVVWATSKRTGKVYLVETFGTYGQGKEFYVKSAIHTTDNCNKAKAEFEAWQATQK